MKKCFLFIGVALFIGVFVGCKKDSPTDNTNNAPNTPSNPSPSNNEWGVEKYADLSWTGGDPDIGSTVTYDVSFGTSSPPPLVSSGQSGTVYDPGTLVGTQTYYWRIMAKDNSGATATSNIWNFKVYGRYVLNWTDTTWVVSAGNHRWSSWNLSTGDSLEIQATLTQGDYIARTFIANETEYYKWKADHSDPSFSPIFDKKNSTGGGIWRTQVPTNAKYYLVIYNDAIFATIKINFKVDRIVWYK